MNYVSRISVDRKVILMARHKVCLLRRKRNRSSRVRRRGSPERMRKTALPAFAYQYHLGLSFYSSADPSRYGFRLLETPSTLLEQDVTLLKPRTLTNSCAGWKRCL